MLSSSSSRVLVADDYRDNADGLALLLRLLGHDVRVAYDGDEATQVAADFGPDVVFMDLTMPRVDGWTAAKQIRATAQGATALLVALSGQAEPGSHRACLEAGFDAHMIKPLDLPAVQALIEAADGRRLATPHPEVECSPVVV